MNHVSVVLEPLLDVSEFTSPSLVVVAETLLSKYLDIKAAKYLPRGNSTKVWEI